MRQIKLAFSFFLCYSLFEKEPRNYVKYNKEEHT